MKKISFLFIALALVVLTGCTTNKSKESTQSSSSTALPSSSEVSSSIALPSSSEASSSTTLPSSSEASSSTILPSSSVVSSSVLPSSSDVSTITSSESTIPPTIDSLDYQGAGGYVADITDFSQYKDTAAHVKVTTVTELLQAIKNAKTTYTTAADNNNLTTDYGYMVRNNTRKNEGNWQKALTKGLFLLVNNEYVQIPANTPFTDTNYTASMTYYEKSNLNSCGLIQELTSYGSVHIIEIMNDIDLGWKKLSPEDQALGIASSFKTQNEAIFTLSTMYKTYGMSQVKIEGINDLLIFSKNGAKLTHGGFKVTSSVNIAFRNLEFDEMWQWEDTSSSSTSKVGDYDAFDWAYFKISHSDNVWIDHCTFGKCYDGLIDVSNPMYTTVGTAFRAPYGADGSSDVHISWCNFKAGSDDKDGYLYKMMLEIENDYLTNNGANYLYYKALRDGGVSFEDILYGLAIPQKKAFLDGDSGDQFFFNYNMRVSIANCYFKNVEDRLPKVRGGVAYMYNTMVDCSQYYQYRTSLKNQNAFTFIAKISYNWKCALVSQGIVCGNGGSVIAENSIFKGVESVLKNNDTVLTNDAKLPDATLNGGYRIVNCQYELTPGQPTDVFPNVSPTTLKEENFTFRTSDNKVPFTPKVVELTDLEKHLLASNYACGSNDSGLDFSNNSYLNK